MFPPKLNGLPAGWVEGNWALLPEDPNGSPAGIAGNDVDPAEPKGLATVLPKGFAAADAEEELPKGFMGAAEVVDALGTFDAVEAIPLLPPNANGPPVPKLNAGGGNELDDNVVPWLEFVSELYPVSIIDMGESAA